MIVAGVMSGTSADGINVALVRITEREEERPSHTIIDHAEYPFPASVRLAILKMMNAESARVADLARMNFLLGELYADAVAKTARQHRVKLDLVGCHGQTLYHQGTAAPFLGRKLAVTWQTGEGAMLAARLGSAGRFRLSPRRHGCRWQRRAPGPVPRLRALSQSPHRTHCAKHRRNCEPHCHSTGCKPGQVIAFDTGPGNMVIDAVTEKLFGKRYDRDGVIAASGRVLDHVIAQSMRIPFFRQKPPKTAGREEFGRAYTKEFLRRCGRAHKRDIVTTAAALTARSIADAVRRFVLRKHGGYQELIVSGGGAHNPTLIAMLRNELAPLGIALRFSDEFGVPTESKEAVAFAVLAYETWHRRPSNVPSATGAKRAAILGKISYA